MTCDRCDGCLSAGYEFCVYCGEYLSKNISDINGAIESSRCERCETDRALGYRFCTGCGKELRRKENPFMSIGFYVGVIVSLILTGLVLFEFTVALWRIPAVMPELYDVQTSMIIIVPSIIKIVNIGGTALQIYYVVLILSVTASIFLYIYRAIGPTIELFRGNTDDFKRTALFETSVLFASMFIAEFVFIMIMTGAGVEVEGLPERETWVMMYSLLEASVWEEVITRILYIGLPVMLIAFFRKDTTRPLWKYLFGGFGMNRTVLFFILFSSLMFAAGHLTNWSLWKLFPTFIFGLITGYLFVRYGVYATIVIHFLNDYLSAESWISGGSSLMTSLILVLTGLACIPYIFVYLKKGTSAVLHLIRDDRVP